MSPGEGGERWTAPPGSRSATFVPATASRSPGPTRAPGPILVKGANWLTHLEYDWESPVWRHWLRFLTGHFHLIRYDERGCGMTDWDVGDLSFERWVEDLETVIGPRSRRGAQGVPPRDLAGRAPSASPSRRGTPSACSRLILYGAYAKRCSRRGDDAAGERSAWPSSELARIGWGHDNPVFRQIFTARFIPDAHGGAGGLVQRPVPEDDVARRSPPTC